MIYCITSSQQLPVRSSLQGVTQTWKSGAYSIKSYSINASAVTQMNKKWKLRFGSNSVLIFHRHFHRFHRHFAGVLSSEHLAWLKNLGRLRWWSHEWNICAVHVRKGFFLYVFCSHVKGKIPRSKHKMWLEAKSHEEVVTLTLAHSHSLKSGLFFISMCIRNGT